MELKDFPHIILINNAKVKKKELSGGILHLISDFEKSYNGYKLKKSEPLKQKLMEKSEVIGQVIYDYFVEEEDQKEETTLSQKIDAVADAVEGTQAEATKSDLVEQVEEIQAIEAVAAPVDPVADPIPLPLENTPPAAVPVVQEPVKPAGTFTAQNNNEFILHTAFLSGKINITRKELAELGFNVSMSGPLNSMGAKFKTYTLKAKKIFSDEYTIVK